MKFVVFNLSNAKNYILTTNYKENMFYLKCYQFISTPYRVKINGVVRSDIIAFVLVCLTNSIRRTTSIEYFSVKREDAVVANTTSLIIVHTGFIFKHANIFGGATSFVLHPTGYKRF